MTFEQIEAFIAIMKYGSLTKAAERLYITQSALSHRIAELEKELGMPLIIRGKGFRNVQLTLEGIKFMPQAEKWNALWKETRHVLSQKENNEIRLAATNSLAGTLLLDLYEKLIEISIPEEIHIMTVSYSDSYQKIETGEIDFAFLIYPLYMKNVATIPIAKEDLVFVCSLESNYPECVSPLLLDPKKEIFLTWSQDCTFWHQHWFGIDQDSLIQTNQVLFVEQFLNRFDAWAIFPYAEAIMLQAQGRLRICSMISAPPPRTLYLAYNKTQVHPKQEIVIDAAKQIVAAHEGFRSV